MSPRARIASAAASISLVVRAASVTCAPAAASAEAAASPMPRPPPVTSARLPSRRKEGVLARSTGMIGYVKVPYSSSNAVMMMIEAVVAVALARMRISSRSWPTP